MRRAAVTSAAAALIAVALVTLVGCPGRGGRAVPAQVEIDWPDAAVLEPAVDAAVPEAASDAAPPADAGVITP